ncbi:MAG TPA: hypothetical protein VF407_22965, partial [Polyangiaceae bacterium]
KPIMPAGIVIVASFAISIVPKRVPSMIIVFSLECFFWCFEFSRSDGFGRRLDIFFCVFFGRRRVRLDDRRVHFAANHAHVLRSRDRQANAAARRRLNADLDRVTDLDGLADLALDNQHRDDGYCSGHASQNPVKIALKPVEWTWT